MTKTLKAIRIATGALLILAGGIVAAAGGAIFATIGSDGTVSSGRQTLAASGAAIVSSVADLRRPHQVADIVGDPRVRVSVDAGKPVFVGVGPARDVERYLAGAPVDEVSDLEVDPFKLRHHPRGGTARPEPPGRQSFWIAKGSGADGATLDWKAGGGQYRLVVMNADASRGVRTHTDVAVTLPHAAPIAWSLLGGGLLLLIGGLATLLVSSEFPATGAVASPRQIQGTSLMPSDRRGSSLQP